MKAKNPAPMLSGILIGLFVLTAWALAAKEAHIRSGHGLCEEVEQELTEAVLAGTLEPGAARLVAERCYNRFGANFND